jgi:hypothetical protein
MLGFVKTGRRRHREASEEEQAAFKKVIMALPGRPEAMKMGPSPR